VRPGQHLSRMLSFCLLVAHAKAFIVDTATVGMYTIGPKVRFPEIAMQTLPDGLAERYAEIAAALPQQEEAYAKWLDSDAVDCAELRETAASLGLKLDTASGTIAYAADFESKRLPLCFDFVYCRHGKTMGNTEPRVYQGFVDEPSNALNEIGLAQAEDAADKLDKLALDPDLIVLSPLSRAAETGLAFVRRHPHLEERVQYWEDAAEMRFGVWDNMMVKDLADDNICHLFYLKQNAIVKPTEPYVRPSDGVVFEAENFVEMSTRMHGVLSRLNDEMRPLAEARGMRPLVVMYGHSMAGAALSILTGNGKTVDGETFLGFDGKYIMPNATPVFLAQ